MGRRLGQSDRCQMHSNWSASLMPLFGSNPISALPCPLIHMLHLKIDEVSNVFLWRWYRTWKSRAFLVGEVDSPATSWCAAKGKLLQLCLKRKGEHRQTHENGVSTLYVKTGACFVDYIVFLLVNLWRGGWVIFFLKSNPVERPALNQYRTLFSRKMVDVASCSTAEMNSTLTKKEEN